MDDHTRDGLIARPSQLKDREADLLLKIKAHAANISETRQSLGNPFYFDGRPAGDPESNSWFTGYSSHEPGLALVREAQELSKQIDELRIQLRESGLGSD
jgi:hypothetical protein